MERGVLQVWFPSWLHPLDRAPSHVMARNGRPNLRTLEGCPGTSLTLGSGIFQGSEEDASTPGSSHWSREMVVGDQFSSFLLEEDGSSFAGFTATIATSLKGPDFRMRKGAQSELLLWHLRG